MYIKMIRYGFYMVFVRLKGIKWSYLNKFKGKEKAWEYAQDVFERWSAYTINAVGMDLEVRGKENIPKETCIFMGNHQSILDIPILKIAAGKTIDLVAKEELVKTPVIGYWIKHLNCVALNRTNVREGVKAINKAIEYVKEGYNYAVFPEGTRSKDGKIHEFKKGSLRIATKSNCPIVPFAVNGTSACFEDTRKFRPGKVVIAFGKAIETKNLTKEQEKSLLPDLETEVNDLFNNMK